MMIVQLVMCKHRWIYSNWKGIIMDSWFCFPCFLCLWKLLYLQRIFFQSL